MFNYANGMIKNALVYFLIFSFLITQNLHAVIESHLSGESASDRDGSDEYSSYSPSIEPRFIVHDKDLLEAYNEGVALIDENGILEDEDQLNDPFLNAVHGYLTGERVYPEEGCAKWQGRVLRAIALLLGSTAGVPFYSPACQASSRSPVLQGSKFLCYSLGVSTVISYGGTCAWVGQRLVDRFISETPSEKKVSSVFNRLNENKGDHWTTKAVYVFCGLIASIPGSWVVYKYNKNKLYVIPAALVEFIIKTEGCFSIIERLKAFVNLFRYSLGNSQNRSENLKTNLVLDIYGGIKNGAPSGITSYIAFKHITDTYNLGISETGTVLEPETMNNHLRKITQAVSLVFPLGNEVLRVILINEAMSTLISSPYVTLPVSILFSLPGLSLDTLATMTTSGNIYDAIYRKIRHGNVEPNFINYFYRKSMIVIFMICFIFSVFSTGGDAYIAYDTAEDSNFPWLKYVLPPLVFTNNLIFETFALTNLIQDLATEAIGRWGRDEMRNAVNITRGYEYAVPLIDTVRPEDFEESEL